MCVKTKKDEIRISIKKTITLIIISRSLSRSGSILTSILRRRRKRICLNTQRRRIQISTRRSVCRDTCRHSSRRIHKTSTSISRNKVYV